MGKLEKHDGTENTDILKVKNSIKGLYHGWRLYKLKWREDWMSLMNYKYILWFKMCSMQSRDDVRTQDEICEHEMADLLYLGKLGARDDRSLTIR